MRRIKNDYNMYIVPVAGVGLGSAYSLYRTNQLKKLENESDSEFEERRRKHIIAGGLTGGASGTFISHGLKHKGQALGSAMGLGTSELMSNSGINFQNMSPQRQEEFLRSQGISRVLGSAGGAIVGRSVSTKKVPGLKKESSLFNRIYNLIN
jgi:hypothetical protein